MSDVDVRAGEKGILLALAACAGDPVFGGGDGERASGVDQEGTGRERDTHSLPCHPAPPSHAIEMEPAAAAAAKSLLLLPNLTRSLPLPRPRLYRGISLFPLPSLFSATPPATTTSEWNRAGREKDKN